MLIGNRTSRNGTNRWVTLEDGVATAFGSFYAPAAKKLKNRNQVEYEVVTMTNSIMEQVLPFTDAQDLSAKARLWIRNGSLDASTPAIVSTPDQA